jgi:hypothetical protein
MWLPSIEPKASLPSSCVVSGMCDGFIGNRIFARGRHGDA